MYEYGYTLRFFFSEISLKIATAVNKGIKYRNCMPIIFWVKTFLNPLGYLDFFFSQLGWFYLVMNSS